MRLTLSFFLLLFLLSSSITAQEEKPLLRYPAFSSDGTQIAFSYQGDIWVVPVTGGISRRLTIHEGYESHPQWSSDDNTILFQGSRFGNSDLYTVSLSGSSPKRLTFHSTTDANAKWGTKGRIYFSTRRSFAQVEREAEIYQLDPNGGTPNRSLDAMGYYPTPSPDGRYIAFAMGSCRISREAYQGPANKNIWIYDNQNKSYHQLTSSPAQEIYPEWGDNNTLYYLSAENGRYNIVARDLSNGQASGRLRKLTNFQEEGIRYFDVSRDGQHIVYEHGDGLFQLEVKGNNQPKEISINVSQDYRFDPQESKSFSGEATDYSVSPNGKYIAMTIRGEIFITQENKEKKRSVQRTKHSFRDREVKWLNDSTLIFISDRNGNNDLFMMRSADPEVTDLFQTFKLEVKSLQQTVEEENNIVLSPEGDKIAFSRGRGQLVVADISSEGTLSNEKLMIDSWNGGSGVQWSPDGQWLAYARDDLDFNREIYIQPADNSSPPINVSLHPRRDANPVWSADGSKLGFLSNRNNGDTDVWFVWLKKEDWEKTNRDWEEVDEQETDKSKGKEKKGSSTVKVEIDFEDIHERLDQVTRLPGNESSLAVSPDGETFYFSTNQGGRQGQAGKRSFYSIKWDGTEMKSLLDDKPVSQLSWDKNGKNIYLLARGGKISKLAVASKKLQPIPFQAKMEIDYRKERAQIFDDGWRALAAGFYDPEFHGQNWESLRKKYETRALSASTSQDFRDMFNEMLGQLNASHMGMSGRNPEQTQRDRTGMLGTELVAVNGGVRVERVLPGSPADRSTSKIAVGDVITAVNGESIGAGINIYSLLKGTVNERTLLAVRDANGTDREVIIRPAASLRGNLYNDWVKERKRLTDEYSNGRLGYIHIQGMNWQSFERFERELTASGLGKDGVVIDVRFNGGGWTTDMLMTVLNVKQHSYTIPRGAAASLDKEHLKFKENYPFGERLPFSSLTKPSIALCNANSYSNAEIFSHAYKHLGIGTLVGEPTFGAVISTGSYGLMDGSRVRMPYRAWYVKATEENMEHGPAIPDIEVYNSPDSKAKGVDEQLKKAVERLLEEMGGKVKSDDD